MPANANRICASVELAQFEEVYGKEWVENEVQNSPGIYTELTFKFFGWYLYFLAYVFCLLLGLKVIELVDPEKETEHLVADIESAISEDSEKSRKRNLKSLETADFGDTFFLPKGDDEVFEMPPMSDGSEKQIPSLAEQLQKADEEQTEAETEIIEL